jgi:mannose-1-phosphate guanylyltransferase
VGETWAVARGTATVIRGNGGFEPVENRSICIPVGSVHCLESLTAEPVHLIEVQASSYLGEDDIGRLDDQ